MDNGSPIIEQLLREADTKRTSPCVQWTAGVLTAAGALKEPASAGAILGAHVLQCWPQKELVSALSGC